MSFAQEKRLKIRLAVAPLDWSFAESWNVPQGFQQAIYEKLTKKLLDTGKFVMLEREALDALLKEQGIKEDNTGQSQKGKIVPAADSKPESTKTVDSKQPSLSLFDETVDEPDVSSPAIAIEQCPAMAEENGYPD